MKMIEYVEEGTLSTRLVHEILNIVDYKHVDRLIEVDELIDTARFCSGCSGVLALEKTRRQIQHSRFWITLLYADTDSLDKMGLAYTRGTEDKEGIEGLNLRIGGDSLAYSARNLIGRAGAIILECILRVKPRIKILHDFSHERIAGTLTHGGTRIDALYSHRGIRVGAYLIVFIKQFHPGTIHLMKRV